MSVLTVSGSAFAQPLLEPPKSCSLAVYVDPPAPTSVWQRTRQLISKPRPERLADVPSPLLGGSLKRQSQALEEARRREQAEKYERIGAQRRVELIEKLKADWALATQSYSQVDKERLERIVSLDGPIFKTAGPLFGDFSLKVGTFLNFTSSNFHSTKEPGSMGYRVDIDASYKILQEQADQLVKAFIDVGTAGLDARGTSLAKAKWKVEFPTRTALHLQYLSLQPPEFRASRYPHEVDGQSKFGFENVPEADYRALQDDAQFAMQKRQAFRIAAAIAMNAIIRHTDRENINPGVIATKTETIYEQERNSLRADFATTFEEIGWLTPSPNSLVTTKDPSLSLDEKNPPLSELRADLFDHLFPKINHFATELSEVNPHWRLVLRTYLDRIDALVASGVSDDQQKKIESFLLAQRHNASIAEQVISSLEAKARPLAEEFKRYNSHIEKRVAVKTIENDPQRNWHFVHQNLLEHVVMLNHSVKAAAVVRADIEELQQKIDRLSTRLMRVRLGTIAPPSQFDNLLMLELEPVSPMPRDPNELY